MPAPASSPAVPTRLRPSLSRDLRFVQAMLRNLLDTLPPEVFTVPSVRCTVLGRKMVYVMDPELVHAALVTSAAHMNKGRSVRWPLGAALGEGLLTAEGADWRWQRRAIAPVFRQKSITRYLPPMIALAGQARDRLSALPAGTQVTVNHETMRLTFEIIVETMLSGVEGFDVEQAGEEVGEYLRLTHWSSLAAVVGAPQWLPRPGRRRAAELAAGLRRRVEARVAVRRADGRPRDDLIDLLLSAADPETGRRMTDVEITDNLMTFLTAGHETTALGLAWTLDLLGRHPEIGARVRAEIAQVTGGAPVRPEHVEALGYTRQVFQEALRLYPPAAIIVRRVIEPFDLGGERLTTGTLVVIPIYAVHRHQSLWEAPHVFDPERFRPEEAARRHRYAFMPFGAGPRVCIGLEFAMLEAVTILAVLLRDLRFTSCDPSPPPPRMEITLRPALPLVMRVGAVSA